MNAHGITGVTIHPYIFQQRERWGCSPQTRTKGLRPLDPQLRMLLDRESEICSRWCLKEGQTIDVVLLARRLKAAFPDAKRPGKA